MKNIISLSGGATRFRGIAGAAVKLLELGFKPDIILGVSAGAIASLPLALGKFDEIRFEGDNLTPEKFFVKCKKPFGEKGNITSGALFRVLTGANSLGEQDVRPLLRDVISQKDWEFYKHSPDTPEIIVFAVDMVRGNIESYNLKNCKDFEDALDKICASSKIQPIVACQELNKEFKADGGFRVHNPAGYFLRKNPDLEVNYLFSVYSREKNFVEIDEKCLDNFLNALNRGIRIMSIEISKGNEREEISEMEKRNAGDRHGIIYLPQLFKDTYGTGEKLKELGEISEKRAENIFNKIFKKDKWNT